MKFTGLRVLTAVLIVVALLPLHSSVQAANDLIYDGGTHSLSGVQIYDNVTLIHGATLIIPATTDTTVSFLTLQVTGTLSIDATSRIDATGLGYLPGYTHGNSTTGGAASLSGGSYGGMAYSVNSTSNGVYGDYLNPDEPGAGSGTETFYSNPQAGGGWLCIQASTLNLDGQILANGGGSNPYDLSGAGGGIRLDVGTLTGSGTIRADAATTDRGGGGGGGRIAIYYTTLNGFNLASQVSATGGTAPSSPFNGAPGTIYSRQAGQDGVLRIDSQGTPTISPEVWTPLGMPSETELDLGSLVISGVGVVVAPEHEMPINAGSIAVLNGAVLTHQPTTASRVYSLQLVVGQTLTVDANSRIDTFSRGYLPGYVQGNATAGKPTGYAGGSYGGLGSIGDPVYTDPSRTNPIYGDANDPVEPGAGSSDYWWYTTTNPGGGLIRIQAGAIQLDGQILANGGGGANSYDLAGAGGGILINAGDLSGSGKIQARGGNGIRGGSGGGGGGRVAIYHWGSLAPTIAIDADGGVGASGNGQAGSLVVTSAPYLFWKLPLISHFHGLQVVSWAGYGFDPQDVQVQLHAYQNGTEIPIQDGLLPADAFTWDTSSTPDGIYELRATFLDSGGGLVGELTRTGLLNNSVTWHSGMLAGDENWTADRVHLVDGKVTVPEGVTLSIQEGAVVKFSSGVSLEVASGGTLNILGATPTILTSLADDSTGGDTNCDGGMFLPQPGDWEGIQVQPGGAANLSAALDERYVGIIHTGSLSTSETWLGTQLHHVTGNVTIPSGMTLTILPGAVVKFDHATSLITSIGGILNVPGTLVQPVTFTSVKDDSVGGDTDRDGGSNQPAPGDWTGVQVYGSAILDHVNMRYGAGSSDGNYQYPTSAFVYSAYSSSLTVSNSHLVDGQWEGIVDGGSGTILNTLIAHADRGINLDGNSTLINLTLDDNRIGLWCHFGGGTGTNLIISNSLEAGVDGSCIPLHASDVWSTTGQNYTDTDQSGTNGNISKDPQYKDPSRNDYRLNYVSPAIDAGDGNTAPAADLVGSARYDDPRTPDTGTGSVTFADLGAYEFVETAPSDVNLVSLDLSGPGQAAVGDEVTLTWKITNHGAGIVTGPWHDELYLVTDPEHRPSLTLLGEILVGQGERLGPSESLEASARVTVPGTTDGVQYWRVTTNVLGEIFEGQDYEDNTAVSQTPVTINVPELLVGGGKAAGQFSATYSPRWYRVIPSPGQPVLLSLHLGNADARGRIYICQEAIPTHQVYDLVSPDATSADSSIFLDNITGMAYYIMVEALELPSGASPFSLGAQVATFSVASVSPQKGGTNGTLTMDVRGTAFPEGAMVKLALPGGGEVLPEAQNRVSGSQIMATFSLHGQSPTTADVVVYQDGQNASLAGGFQILPGWGSRPDFWMALSAPSATRAGRQATFTLRYGNRGEIDAPAYLLELVIPPDLAVSLEPDSPPRSGHIYLLTVTPGAPKAVIPPGYTGTLTFYGKPGISNQNRIQVYATAVDTYDLIYQPINWSLIAALARPVDMLEADWQVFWDQLTGQLGDTWADMLPVLAQDSVDLSQQPAMAGELVTGTVDLLVPLLKEIDKAIIALGWNPSSNAISEELMTPQAVRARRTQAIIFTAQNYYHGIGQETNLPGTYRDGKRVYNFLTKNAQVPGSAVTWMNNGNRPGDQFYRENDLLNALQNMADNSEAGDTIFFYFGGHGGGGIVSPIGSATMSMGWNPVNSGDEVPYVNVYNRLHGSQAHIVVVVDACHSGNFVDWMNTYHQDESSHFSIVTSANTEQTSSDGGYFTNAFFSSMGKTDDLYQSYLQNQTISPWLLPVQNPKYFGSGTSESMQDPLGKVKEPIEHNPTIQWLNLPHLEIDQIIQNYLSGDPNEKYTTGVGPQGFIAQDQAIQYTIDFENSASVGATAPLQELLVTDQLSSNLDWSTVQLESIHLGSWEIPCLAMNDTCMAGSALPDNPYPVRVEAALNRASGTLTWHVWSEDRVTGTLPEDPFAGFLPVNDATGRGLGSVTFRVYPVAGQLEGTQIANQAIITFDPTYGSNPPISTASVVNTIDATGPSSFIIAAPTSPASYDVSWSGSDGSGSGVASFDIFVAIDDQPAEIWLTGTTGSGAVYTGMAGHTYKFLIWATDRVGNSRAGLSGSFLLYLPLVRR